MSMKGRMDSLTEVSQKTRPCVVFWRPGSTVKVSLKNPKFPFRTPERPMSLFYSFKQDTHTDIALYIYLDSCTDIMYHCTQLVQMKCTSANKTHINGTHTHTFHCIYIYSFTDLLLGLHEVLHVFICFPLGLAFLPK